MHLPGAQQPAATNAEIGRPGTAPVIPVGARAPVFEHDTGWYTIPSPGTLSVYSQRQKIAIYTQFEPAGSIATAQVDKDWATRAISSQGYSLKEAGSLTVPITVHTISVGEMYTTIATRIELGGDPMDYMRLSIGASLAVDMGARMPDGGKESFRALVSSQQNQYYAGTAAAAVVLTGVGVLGPMSWPIIAEGGRRLVPGMP